MFTYLYANLLVNHFLLKGIFIVNLLGYVINFIFPIKNSLIKSAIYYILAILYFYNKVGSTSKFTTG